MADEKSGAILGFVVGVFAWAWVVGYVVFAPAPELASEFWDILALFMSMASVVVYFDSLHERHAVLTTFGNGIVYGFTAGYVVFPLVASILSGLLSGQFPKAP